MSFDAKKLDTIGKIPQVRIVEEGHEHIKLEGRYLEVYGIVVAEYIIKSKTLRVWNKSEIWNPEPLYDKMEVLLSHKGFEVKRRTQL